MNADRFIINYERIADAPDAIVRMRRFILDLAVRGRLVPQHPKDEPASELLERIAQEKARLGKSQGTRLGAPRSGDSHEVPFDLMPGWQAATIDQILLALQTGPFGSSLHQSDYQLGGVPVVNPASIQGERIVPIAKMAVGKATLKRLSTFQLKAGDIVMGRRGEMGRCAVVTEREAGWLCGTGSLILRFPRFVFGRFFALLIGSPYVRDYLAGSAVGATMQNLNQGILLSLAVGLPPVAEQHRIVAKVDELMALCDRLEAARATREATSARLTTATLARLNAPVADAATFRNHARFALDALPMLTTRRGQIQQLRETILNLAVRGKLVRQDPLDEPSRALLDHLAQRLSLPANRQSGRSRGGPSDRAATFEVGAFPDSWAVTCFDRVSVIASGVAKGKSYSGRRTQSYAYLRVANVQRGYLDLSVVKTIDIPIEEFDRYSLRRGDVLMTEGGDWDKLGRAAIWSEEVPSCIHQNHIFRIRSADAARLMPKWIVLFANSPLGRSYFEGASKQTTNLASINMTQLRNCPLPIPPTAEQLRIVAKVDELMALCDQLEVSLASADDTRSRLFDSLLAEALAHDGAGSTEAARVAVLG